MEGIRQGTRQGLRRTKLCCRDSDGLHETLEFRNRVAEGQMPTGGGAGTEAAGVQQARSTSRTALALHERNMAGLVADRTLCLLLTLLRIQRCFCDAVGRC